MLILLSSSKTMEESFTWPSWVPVSHPPFPEDTASLVGCLRAWNPVQWEKYMGISPRLAQLNYERILQWDSIPSVPALWAFKGEVFATFKAQTLDNQSLEWAQDHLRILSGLYGILRPLDKILPYRLEMGLQMEKYGGPNLYDLWSEKLSNYLKYEKYFSGGLANLASQEYSRSIASLLMDSNTVTPVFQDCSSGRYTVLGYYSKQARGAMARWLTETKPDRWESIKDFKGLGYVYQSHISTSKNAIFRRKSHDFNAQ